MSGASVATPQTNGTELTETLSQLYEPATAPAMQASSWITLPDTRPVAAVGTASPAQRTQAEIVAQAAYHMVSQVQSGPDVGTLLKGSSGNDTGPTAKVAATSSVSAHRLG